MSMKSSFADPDNYFRKTFKLIIEYHIVEKKIYNLFFLFSIRRFLRHLRDQKYFLGIFFLKTISFFSSVFLSGHVTVPYVTIIFRSIQFYIYFS